VRSSPPSIHVRFPVEAASPGAQVPA
jgi:hypothetical protein